MSGRLMDRDRTVLLRGAWRAIRNLAAEGYITELEADRLCADAYAAWVEANRKDD